MKNKLRITAIAAILILAASMVTNAQNFRRTNNRMSFPGQCLEIPGLTDAQKQQITAINDAHQKTIDTMREQFYNAPDFMAANEIKAKMTLEQNNHLDKVSKVLNEEQLAFLKENIVAGPSGRGGRAYNRAPRGGRGNAYNSGAPGRGRNRAVRGGRGRGAGYGNWY